MASKSYTDQRPTALSIPPLISLTDRLLSSRITLPHDPCIVYSKFAPTPSSLQPRESIELARRLILSRNTSTPLLGSMLTSIHVGSHSFIYVFVISTQSLKTNATSAFNDLHLDGLTAIETSCFSPQELYPCSSSCARLRKQCPACMDPHTPAPGAPSPSRLLPRKPLRIVYSHFLEAVRNRVLDDIAETSANGSHNQSTWRPVKRLRGGFLLGPLVTASEWSSGWEHRTLSRPLIYCQLQIHLSHQPKQEPSALILHPLLLPTPFLPLGTALPVPAGTPITLLPHGTPAFFLTHYTGPTSALSKQFQDSLQGMGVTGWEKTSFFCAASPLNRSKYSSECVSSGSSQSPSFIIAWISVENKQGEDKGIVLIYPNSLCLSFVPSSSPARQSLDYIPELPVPLQPSPQVPNAPPPILASILGQPGRSTPSANKNASSFLQGLILPVTPTSDCLRAFRTFTLSRSKDVRHVASEVGGYIDAVARERERERERLRRERERGSSSSPRLARTTATTPAAAPTPAIDPPTPTVAIVPTQVTPLPAAVPSQQGQLSAQNFYPSPPQTNISAAPTRSFQTSPIVETSPEPSAMDASASLPAVAPSVEPSPAPPPPSTTNPTSFDPFANIDSSWSQSQPYLSMDVDMGFGIDLGMGFNMDMNSMAGGSGGRDNYDSNRGMDFEDAFTDDDFSFFDRPSGPPAAPPSPPPVHLPGLHAVSGGSAQGLIPSAARTPITGMAISPSLFGDVNLFGPGPPPPMSTPVSHENHQSPPWAANGLVDGSTPWFPEHVEANLPDFLSSSPRQTPEGNSVPATPGVHLEYDPAIQRPSAGSSSFAPRIFDPIPFAPYHRVADGKYAVGKFALPSPPDEEDRTEPLPLSYLSSSPSNTSGWKFKYMAATDPRIGVVRKLIGVKRKSNFEEGMREGVKMSPASPAWVREHEDWEKNATNEEDNEDARSEAESDDEDVGENDSPLVSRPSTPAPAYLPLGPTLLHTQFQHSQLLPLSTPLRPPGAAVAPINIIASTPLPSVPTPVSPAATMGAKSKSLEAAASTVATEIVENPLWAQTWRANTLGSMQTSETRSADVKMIASLLEAVPSLEGPHPMSTLFGLDSSHNSETLQVLESPMISVGKSDAVIHTLPTALRFWEKLGLGPRGRKKHATAFVLFEDDGEQRQQQVETWLGAVASAYEAKHLGSLTPGNSNGCPRDGLFPLRFDPSFRKSLSSFITTLPTIQSSVVFFIVTPITIMTLASPTLRQVFSAAKKALRTHSEPQVLFQFVPEQLIAGTMDNSPANPSDVETLCYSIYNRILLPVDRLMSRQLFEHGEPIRNYFQEPAFALARPVHNSVSFIRAPHASLGVMDRNTFVHIGYRVSPCGRWILAACIDQRGEAYELGVWLTQTPGEGDAEVEVSDEMYLVRKIWGFALQFAKRANIEWRMVITRLGVMGEGEASAWVEFLPGTIATCHELPPVHVTLLCVEPDTPWTFITTRPSSIKPQTPAVVRSSSGSSPKHHSARTIFTDVSSTTYALFPRTHLPPSLSPTLVDLGLSRPLIPETLPSSSYSPHCQVIPSSPDSPSSESIDTSSELSTHPHPLTLRPRSTTTLIRVPCTPCPAAISMLHIYLLHTVQSAHKSPLPDEAKLHAEITRNFHELAVLAGCRWKLEVNPSLPFHLAAVEAMWIALDRDLDRLDSADT